MVDKPIPQSQEEEHKKEGKDEWDLEKIERELEES